MQHFFLFFFLQIILESSSDKSHTGLYSHSTLLGNYILCPQVFQLYVIVIEATHPKIENTGVGGAGLKIIF